ncbi:RNA 2',3'-cyclic phosphodiesterase [Pseudomonas sp. LPB0260]|uniref:RNA 2',3'-cyclic phosphodiesterase n=1 Tax=Pseudomonas sp. LPB0260 TaxID=2614442 RepID=UPI0015C29ED2|nr:RNA 2',3'-cyclic phosphodiesterase [Pseudomonas sp. LPB0260]QLC72273.1 RNA 2',3'-cyclic phosphodiesterase [Pseudomonas sp. LPB0260]QLC75050.1 RNA 2',3'-cyclic phosphodiesterase [Pseudomonas sp. LPB0260]
MHDDTLRLFFALSCPPGLAERIGLWHDGLHLPGRPVPPANLHLTLAFLGQQPGSRLAELKGLAATVQSRAFELQLDRLVHRRNGLLYLAPSQPPAALLELVEQLHEALLGGGFGLEARPFLAHLTLLRRCSTRRPKARPTFDWPVDHFALFASETGPSGSVYQQLQQWPLLRND